MTQVTVVLGAGADEARPLLDGTGARPVLADDWAAGMAASLRAGLRALATRTRTPSRRSSRWSTCPTCAPTSYAGWPTAAGTPGRRPRGVRRGPRPGGHPAYDVGVHVGRSTADRATTASASSSAGAQAGPQRGGRTRRQSSASTGRAPSVEQRPGLVGTRRAPRRSRHRPALAQGPDTAHHAPRLVADQRLGRPIRLRAPRSRPCSVRAERLGVQVRDGCRPGGAEPATLTSPALAVTR